MPAQGTTTAASAVLKALCSKKLCQNSACKQLGLVGRLGQARHTNDNHNASRHDGSLLASGTGDGPSHFPLICFAYYQKKEQTGDQSSLMLREVQDGKASLASSPAPQTATKVLQQKGIEK